jgi:hypothetical protein
MDFKLSDLAKPFQYEDVEWRAGATNKDKTKALALAYITSRAVMSRLDDVCGPQNWQDDYRPGPDGGVLAGIGIRVGDEWIWKWDGAENSNIEAVKGGLSDAFKRAAVKWGIGRYLYGLDGVWVECEAFGNTVKLKGSPKLPAWALPSNAPAPTNGGGKPPAPETVTQAEKDAPAPQPVDKSAAAWAATIAEIAKAKRTTPEKLRPLFEFSQAGISPDTSVEVATVWLDYYSEARKREAKDRLTPPEAGAYADEMTAKAFDLGAIN